MGTEKKLFKDRINKTDMAVLAKELISAIEAGENTLLLLLLGTTEPELYSEHGSYGKEKQKQHNHCGGLRKEAFTEKRLCKCLYYRNGAYHNPDECSKCDFQDRFDIVGDYRISDYEVPAHYYGKGIGEIDLIISDGKKLYATEVKPYKGNDETLLRMVAEIMTYTIGYPVGEYEKAIAFFEGTKQAGEFEDMTPEIAELLQKAEITVFCFKEEEGKKYRICRLSSTVAHTR